jgi:hypothetical protein
MASNIPIIPLPECPSVLQSSIPFHGLDSAGPSIHALTGKGHLFLRAWRLTEIAPVGVNHSHKHTPVPIASDDEYLCIKYTCENKDIVSRPARLLEPFDLLDVCDTLRLGCVDPS